VDEVDEQRMTLVEHLAELRSRLIKSLLAVGAGMTICWIAYPIIYDALVHPLCVAVPDHCELVITDPLQGFATRLKVAGYGGIALAMPVLLWQLWRFITPGLYPHERKYAIPFVGTALVLFFMGAGLAYWTLPRALGFLVTIGGDLEPFFTPDKYISLIVYMMLAFGLGFEFPILLIFLELAGILSYKDLVKFRRYAIVGIVVLVAVITPSGDPFSLAVLSIPMYLFYEGAILFGWLRDRRRRRAGVDVDVD
jgi:sec-independent protein translocase protein TatC